LRRLFSFVQQSKRFGYCAENTAGITEQFDEADGALLKRIVPNENHTLYHLFPPRMISGANCASERLKTDRRAIQCFSGETVSLVLYTETLIEDTFMVNGYEMSAKLK